MPTKTNSNSPLTIPAAAILPIIKAGVGGVANVIKNKKAATEAGEEYSFKEGAGDFFTGGADGFLGTNFSGGAGEGQQQQRPNYTTNINAFGEEIADDNTITSSPFGMTTNKPIKSLTGVQAPMTYKMSAAQYKSAMKMSNISGANTLPERSDLKMADLSGDGKTTFKDVLIGRGVLDEEGNKIKKED
jgi:hypothetical protein